MFRTNTKKCVLCRLGLLCFMCLLILLHSQRISALSLGAAECGDLKNHFGPFDYRDQKHRVVDKSRGHSDLGIVEGAHFTPEVENLVKGYSSFDPYDDIEYTLLVFPNHHRALYAVARYFLKKDTRKANRRSLECWFDRAMRFTPDDGMVQVIYGVVLARKGKQQEALSYYKKAVELMPDSAEVHYNIGLLYADMKRLELANKHANIAYNNGFPLPGLRNKLIRLGAWKPDTVQ